MQLNIEIEVQDRETLTLEIIDAPIGGGGGGGAVIDDAAGLGDTGVTWSADKSSKELADKVDKVAGYSLVDDDEIAKLLTVEQGATSNRADSENADKVHNHIWSQVTGLGTAATTNNGVGFGQNIINSAVSGAGNISYSGTLLNNTTGRGNTASGRNALQGNTSGYNNTASGSNALLNNTSGGRNTASGVSALLNNTSGNNNTASGSNALLNNTSGNNNTASGSNALLNNTAYDNCGGFGYDSQVTASNQIQLGDASTTVYAYGAVQDRSDARDKAEVRDTVLGLDFINAIRPVDYKLDMREDYRAELGDNPTEAQLEANKLANIKADGTHTRKRYHHGVIAQEVASVIDALGVDFGGFQDHSKCGGDDVLSIGYAEFIAPLIKAVQELSAKVKELEGKVEHKEVIDETITRNQE